MEDYKKSKKFVSNVITELLRGKDIALVRTMARHENYRRTLEGRITELQLHVESAEAAHRAAKDEVEQYDGTVKVLNRALLARLSDKDVARELSNEAARRRDASSTIAQRQAAEKQREFDELRRKLKHAEHEVAARKTSEGALQANVSTLKRALEMLLARAENVMDAKGAQAVEQLIQDAEQDLTQVRDLKDDPKLLRMAQEKQKDIAEMSKFRKEFEKLQQDKKTMEQALRKAEQDVVQMRLRLMERDSAMAMAGKRVKAFEVKLEEEVNAATKRVADAERHAVEVTKRFEDKLAIATTTIEEKEKELGERQKMVDHFRTQVQEEKSRMVRMRKELEAAQEAAERELRADLDRARKSEGALKAELATTTDTLESRIQEIESEAAELKRTGADASVQLTSALERLTVCQVNVKDQAQTIETLEHQLEESESQRARYADDIAGCRRQIDGLIRERDGQMDRLEEVAVQNMAMTQKLESAVADKDALQKKLGDAARAQAIREVSSGATPTKSNGAAGRSPDQAEKPSRKKKGRSPTQGKRPKNTIDGAAASASSASEEDEDSGDGESFFMTGEVASAGGAPRKHKSSLKKSKPRPQQHQQGGGGEGDSSDVPSPMSPMAGSLHHVDSVVHMLPAAPKLSPRSERILRHHAVLADSISMADKPSPAAGGLALEALQKKMAAISEWRSKDPRAQHISIAKRIDVCMRDLTDGVIQIAQGRMSRGQSVVVPDGSAPPPLDSAVLRHSDESTSDINASAAATPAAATGSSNARKHSSVKGGKLKTKPSSKSLKSLPSTNHDTTRDADVDVGGCSDDDEPAPEDSIDPAPATGSSTLAGASDHQRTKAPALPGRNPPSAPDGAPEAPKKVPSMTTVTLGLGGPETAAATTPTVASSVLAPAPQAKARTTSERGIQADLSDAAVAKAGGGMSAFKAARQQPQRKPSTSAASPAPGPASAAGTTNKPGLGLGSKLPTTTATAAPSSPNLRSGGGSANVAPKPTTAEIASAEAAAKEAAEAMAEALRFVERAEGASRAALSARAIQISWDAFGDFRTAVADAADALMEASTNRRVRELEMPQTGPDEEAGDDEMAAVAGGLPPPVLVSRGVSPKALSRAPTPQHLSARKAMAEAEQEDRQLHRARMGAMMDLQTAVATLSDLVSVATNTETDTDVDTRRPPTTASPPGSASDVKNAVDSVAKRVAALVEASDSDGMSAAIAEAVTPFASRAFDAVSLPASRAVVDDRRIGTTHPGARGAAASASRGGDGGGGGGSMAGSLAELKKHHGDGFTSVSFDIADGADDPLGAEDMPMAAPPAALRYRSPSESSDGSRQSPAVPSSLRSSAKQSPGGFRSPHNNNNNTASATKAAVKTQQLMAVVLQSVGAFLREASALSDDIRPVGAEGARRSPSPAGAVGTSALRSRSPSPGAPNCPTARSVRSPSPVSTVGSTNGSFGPQALKAATGSGKLRARLLPSSSPPGAAATLDSNAITPDTVGRKLDEVLRRLREAADEQRVHAVKLAKEAAEAAEARMAADAAATSGPSRVSRARANRRKLDVLLRQSRRRAERAAKGLDGSADANDSSSDADDDSNPSSHGTAAGDDEAGSRRPSPTQPVGGIHNSLGEALFGDGISSTGARMVETGTDSQTDVWDPSKIQRLAQEYVEATGANAALSTEVEELVNFIEHTPEFERIADAVDQARTQAPQVALYDPDEDESLAAEARKHQAVGTRRQRPPPPTRSTREAAVAKALATVQQRLTQLELGQVFEQDVQAGVALALAAQATEPVRGVDAPSILAETRGRSLRAVIAALAQQVNDTGGAGDFAGAAFRAFPRAVIKSTAASGCSPQATYALVEQLASWWNEWRPKLERMHNDGTEARRRTLERMLVLCDRLETAGVSSLVEFQSVALAPSQEGGSSRRSVQAEAATPAPFGLSPIERSTASALEGELDASAAAAAVGDRSETSPLRRLLRRRQAAVATGDEHHSNRRHFRSPDELDSATSSSSSSDDEDPRVAALFPKPTEAEVVAAHLHEVAIAKRQALLDQLGDSKLCHTPGAFASTMPRSTLGRAGANASGTLPSMPPNRTEGFSLHTAGGGAERDMRAEMMGGSRGSLRSREFQRPPPRTAAEGGRFVDWMAHRNQAATGGLLDAAPALGPAAQQQLPPLHRGGTASTPPPHGIKAAALGKGTPPLHRSSSSGRPPPSLTPVPRSTTSPIRSGNDVLGLHVRAKSRPVADGGDASLPVVQGLSPASRAVDDATRASQQPPPPTAVANRRRRTPLPVAATATTKSLASRGGPRTPAKVGIDDSTGRHWNTAARTPVVKTRNPVTNKPM